MNPGSPPTMSTPERGEDYELEVSWDDDGTEDPLDRPHRIARPRPAIPLVDIETDFDTDTTSAKEGSILLTTVQQPPVAKRPVTPIQPKPVVQVEVRQPPTNIIPELTAINELEFLRHPNIFTVEEDEDYGEFEHPAGFRRANVGDMAERSGVPHDAEYTLPSRRHPEFDVRFFGNRNNNILHIARKTGTHISMPTSMEEPVLLMWGTPEAIAKARFDLHLLFQHVGMEIDAGIRRVGGWAKVKAGPTARRQALIDELMLSAKVRRLYRQYPPEGSTFNSVGLFIWPGKEMNPQQSLGMALEALDDIRFEQRVFITFARKRNIFRVMGENPKNVELAIDRVYGTFCEVASKSRRPTRMCLTQPPNWANMSGTRVTVIENHALINRQVSVKRTGENKGIQVYLGGEKPNHRFIEKWKVKSKALDQANEAFLKKALEQALIDMQYYRGHAKLRVYIGRMVFYGYRRAADGTYGLLEFDEMVRNPQTAGEVIRSIGNSKYGIKDKETAERIIRRCGSRQDIFQPVDFNPERDGPMEPQTSATFNIRLSDDKGHSEDVRLEVVFQRMPGTKEYQVLNHRWLKASPDGRNAADTFSRRKGPVDIKVMDLDADLTYQVEIATWPLYKERDNYPIFTEFNRRLRLEEIPDELHSTGPPAPGQPDRRPQILRVSFVNLPGLSVAAVVQKTKWRYWMSSTSYFFELTRYEMLPMHEVNSIFPEGVPVSYKGLRTPFDTRWGCSLGNSKWDEKLDQHATIPLGYKANWDPKIDQFFEVSDSDYLNDDKADWGEDGFKEFTVRVKEAVHIVREAQREAAFNKRPARAPVQQIAVARRHEQWARDEQYEG